MYLPNNVYSVKGIFFSILIGLTGWTVTTYLVKEDSQKFIKEELKNLFDNCKMLFVSIKTLIGVLAKHSFSSESGEARPAEPKEFDDQLLKLVQPVQPVQPVDASGAIESSPVEVSVKEDEDTALSSFSPELIAVITDEEEKIA